MISEIVLQRNTIIQAKSIFSIFWSAHIAKCTRMREMLSQSSMQVQMKKETMMATGLLCHFLFSTTMSATELQSFLWRRQWQRFTLFYDNERGRPLLFPITMPVAELYSSLWQWQWQGFTCFYKYEYDRACLFSTTEHVTELYSFLWQCLCCSFTLLFCCEYDRAWLFSTTVYLTESCSIPWLWLGQNCTLSSD